MSEPGVAFGRLEQVGTRMGHPFEYGPHHLGPARAPGQPEDGSPGAEVPLRGAEAEQGGDRDDSPGVLAGGGDGFGLGGAGEQAEVLDEPVDGGAGGQHDCLHAPGRFAVAPPGDDRKAPARAPGGETRAGGADEHVEHAAGAEGCLGQPRPGATLAHERRLLISDQGAQGRSAGQGGGLAERPAGVDDCRQACRGGMPSRSRASSRQAGLVRAVQAGQPRVAGVGDVESPLGDLPGQPAVNRAEPGVRPASGSAWSA